MATFLLVGRDFDDGDTPSSTEVAVVNQEFSKKCLGGSDPLGKRFRVLSGPGEPEHVYQIVGLVKNSKYQSLREDFKPLVFVAERQAKQPRSGSHFIVCSSLPIGSLLGALITVIFSQ